MAVVQTDRGIPRGILLGAGALIGVTLLGALSGRIGERPPLVAESRPVVAMELRFDDVGDGSVAVRDAASGREVERVEPATGGFLRSTVRGLVRERRAQGFGPEQPFRLTRWADGRLTLDDPATGRRLELEAFGATNTQAFARLLPARTATQ